MAHTIGVLSKCPTCGRNFEGRVGQCYCSSSCRWRYNNFSKVTKPFKPAIYDKCAKCGSEFLQASKNQLYCSSECRLVVKYSKRKNRNRNKNFIKKFGFCEVCGFSLPQALEAHHYSKRELVTLCGNCHNIWHRLSKDTYAPKEQVIKVISKCLLEHSIKLP